MNFLNYWRLYCKIFRITICRKCGRALDKNYKERKRGKLCVTCFVKEVMEGIDIVMLQ